MRFSYMFGRYGRFRWLDRWREVSREASRFTLCVILFVLRQLAQEARLLGRSAQPELFGPHAVGCRSGRLPTARGTHKHGLLARLHYPAWTGSVQPSAETCQHCKTAAAKAACAWAGAFPADPPYPPAAPKAGKWPLVVFECGLCAVFDDDYTQICRDMASMGTIVVVLAHEEGTTSIASDSGSGSLRKHWRQRRVELCESLAAMRAISSEQSADFAGDPIETVLSYANMEALVLVGHSSGARDIVHTLLESPVELASCRGALLLDFWPGSLTTCVKGKFCEDLGATFPVPHVSLLSQALSDNERCGPDCLRFEIGSPRSLGAFVVPGSAHYWISDWQFSAPHWLLRLIGVMGPADASTSYRSTLQAVQASLALFVKSAAPLSVLHEVPLLKVVGT